MEDTQSTGTTTETTSTESPGSGRSDYTAEIAKGVDEVLGSSPDEKDNEKTEPTEKAAKSTEDSPEEISWDKVDPKVRKKYEDTQKSYDHIRSLYSKEKNEWVSGQEKFKGYETQAQQFARLNQLYETDPNVRAALDRALGIKPNIDPSLEGDPAIQYTQNMERQFNQQLRPLMEYVKTAQERERSAMLDNEVNKATQSAVNEYKSHFGKEPTETEIAEIYKHMTENKVYDGKSAVRAIHMDKVIQAKVQAALEAQTAKKTIGAKTSTVNSSKANTKGKISSYGDAFEAAAAELGITF